MALESVFILIGSNLGERKRLVNQACKMMEERCGVLISKSKLYESEPWGFEAEHWFLNQVVRIDTVLSPDELMKTQLSIEKELGRDRSVPHEGYVSRSIDLDILYYGEEIVDTEMVAAPHPRLQERRFVLVPLCDVAPCLVHPLLRKTNRQLLEECQDKGKVNIY